MVQCCSAQRKLDKRHLIDPDIMRDLVIGLADGLTVPFALTAGLSALGSTHLVVTGGVAELISGAFSMGIGIGYLLGGIVPLLPYIIIKGSVLVALWWSIGVTAVVLLTFGGLKAYYTGAGQTFLGVAYGATSTLAIGGAAAAASYGVVKALNR
ncbi:hypothetical protein RQP46_003679 [Phenoliferia psychrophenolica]